MAHAVRSDPRLIYLRARYYDPSTAQFISRDPAVATTRQPYAYVNDNPLNATDPSGLFGFSDLVNLGKAAVKSVELDVLSVTGSILYAPYSLAGEANKHFAHNPLSGAFLGVQHASLGWDEKFDNYEYSRGYIFDDPKLAPANDEGAPAAHVCPSFFYPSWTGSGWKQNKVVWGPGSPADAPRGRGPNGHEDYIP